MVDVVTAVGRHRTAILKHEERRNGETETERDEEVLSGMKRGRVVDALNPSLPGGPYGVHLLRPNFAIFYLHQYLH